MISPCLPLQHHIFIACSQLFTREKENARPEAVYFVPKRRISIAPQLWRQSYSLESMITWPFRLIALSYTDHRTDSVGTERTLWLELDLGSRPTPLSCVALGKLLGFCIIHKVGRLSNCYKVYEVHIIVSEDDDDG